MSSIKELNSTLFLKALVRALDKYAISQAKLATMTGIPRARINEYCLGKTDPGFKNVSKIATTLNLTIPEFLMLGVETAPEKPNPAPPRDEKPVTRADLDALEDKMMKKIQAELRGQRDGRPGMSRTVADGVLNKTAQTDYVKS